MENENFKAMVSNIARKGFKNKQTLGFAVVAPLIVLIVLGYMVTMAGYTEPVKIGVINNDKGIGNFSAATSIVNEIKNQENVTVLYINEADVKNDLDDKTITAAVTFPENFTTSLAKNNADLNIELEGTDQTANMLVSKAVSTSVSTVAAKTTNQTSPLKINVDNLYGNGLDFTDLFMYRFMTIVTLVLSVLLGLFSIMGDKETEVFKNRAATPIKTVFAYITGLSVFALILALITLAFGIYALGLTIVGNTGAAALLMFLIAMVGLSLGVLIASITRTRTQGMGLFGLLLILQIVFSGTFVPVSKFNSLTQLISYSLPLTYSLDSMKSIFIKGFTLGEVGTDITALIIIFAVALILSMIGLKTVQGTGNGK
ncbi:ABC-2 type transporter [Methanobacterium lacus]|uniref:ABC-2 type transporter n=1 Tax=Methanobacterium lacus (strain AL-21) TaxID=877455 RepID=F0T8E6_METLA|nr:ABC transporter permease [Methanobacterium lacus]ADZ09697.1 ABC-2 type transporter [Methanobacterium lacus]